MSKRDKLLERLLEKPSAFTYIEARGPLLSRFGYREDNRGHTSGSRVAFVHVQTKHMIRLHKPHSGNVLKKYQLDELTEALKTQGVISTMKDVMFYKDFIGSIHFSTEDEIFFGKIEGIDDSIGFEGSSVEDLKSSFREAVEDYIELCKLNGKEPQKVYKGTFNIRISPEMHKQAVREATIKGISLNQFVESAIAEKVSASKTANKSQ